MSLCVEADIYQVKVDDNGTYIDSIPLIKNGIKCVCGSRKDHIFNTPATLKKHFSTEKHQIWLRKLNLEKANHYVELIKTQEILEQQKKQINDLKLELQENNKIIIKLKKENSKLRKPIHVPVENSKLRKPIHVPVENLLDL